MSFSVKVDFDAKKILDKFDFENAQKKLDAKVLADSNFFIPKDTSTLEKSSIIFSKIGSGRLIWNTPYAKAQYYGDNFDHSKQRNPNACSKWFETAKTRYINDWRKLVDECIKHC